MFPRDVIGRTPTTINSMRINRVAIKAFRSLYDIEFEPGSFTVLAGPNNAGKSTLASALSFLSEAYLYGLEWAVNRQGGFENIAYRRVRRTRQPVSFTVEAELGFKEGQVLRSHAQRVARELGASGFSAKYGAAPRDWDSLIHFAHAFSFRAESEAIEATFAVTKETVRLSAEGQTLVPLDLAFIERTGQRIDHDGDDASLARDPLWSRAYEPFDDERYFEFVEESMSPTDLMIDALNFNQIVRHAKGALSELKLFQLNPLEGRLPGAPTPNAELARYGRNLPALVAWMARNAPDAWQSVLSAMRGIMPGLADIKTTFTPDRRLTIQFWDAEVDRGWNPEEVSDGTIQSLALFLALHDPRSTLIVIEEPENSLHPWILRRFIDACRSAVGKQIVLTTHSPALLAYLTPDEVTLVWRREGRSHVAPLTKLDPSARAIWSEGSGTVYEILDGGFVRETIPEGFV
jgi:predicted ATPase